jgi:DNA-binding IclR family transcriptional regulator
MAICTKNKNLIRGLEILELLLDESSISAAQVTKSLGIPRSTAFSLMGHLFDRGYLERDARHPHRYTFGRQLHRLGAGYQSGSRLLTEGQPILTKLASEIGATVQLSVLDQDMNLVLLREHGNNRIRMIFRVGVRSPINWSASGTLLVSHLSDSELRARLEGKIPPSPTGLAPTDVADVIAEVRQFRRRGYALKICHAHQHLVTVAAPVIDRLGNCIAAITALCYEFNFTPRYRPMLIQGVKQAALDLGGRLQVSHRRGSPNLPRKEV